MSIREDIENQYKKSIKEKNIDQTNTLRLVKSAIKDKDIAVRSDGVKNGISDQEILSLFQNLIKQRKDSIESFKTANRKDLIEKEKIEIEIINSFLPNQKNEKETEEAILGIIEKEQLSSLKDMGKLMNLLKNTYAGQIDMSLAGKIAKTKLTNK
tara:strand:+ start:3299 stop:3763 length:465 start_codon:yes stop_codon:yes gene_type:complete